MLGIEIGDTFAVGRMRRFPMDPDGWGETIQTIGPRDPGQEYVAVVLGRVRRGQRITQESVVQALRDILAREEELLAATPTDCGGGRLAVRRPFRLAIVGSRSLAGHPEALCAIHAALDAYQARHGYLVVISGGAAGIDRMAAAEARRRRLEVIEHLPAGLSWHHYRERNRRIAEDCDHLVRIADPRSRTYGSGWTRDCARRLGRPTFEYAITGRPAAPSASAAAALRGNDA